MRFPLLLVKLCVLAVLPIATVFAQDPALVRHFDYDNKAPLELKTKPLQAKVTESIPELYQPSRPN